MSPEIMGIGGPAITQQPPNVAKLKAGTTASGARGIPPAGGSIASPVMLQPAETGVRGRPIAPETGGVGGPPLAQQQPNAAKAATGPTVTTVKPIPSTVISIGGRATPKPGQAFAGEKVTAPLDATGVGGHSK